MTVILGDDIIAKGSSRAEEEISEKQEDVALKEMLHSTFREFAGWEYVEKCHEKLTEKYSSYEFTRSEEAFFVGLGGRALNNRELQAQMDFFEKHEHLRDHWMAKSVWLHAQECFFKVLEE